MAKNINRKIRKFVPEFEDNKKSSEPITIEFKPLAIDDYCELLDISQKSRENTEIKKDDTGQVIKNNLGNPVVIIKNFTVAGQLALRMLPVFKKNITKISNLTINNRPIKIEELVADSGLIELNSETMNEMIFYSTISENDKKK